MFVLFLFDFCVTQIDTILVTIVFLDVNRLVPERFKVWVNSVGGKLETPSDFNKKKRICDIHFFKGHKNRNKRLSTLAVPPLYLPGGSVSALHCETVNPTTSSTAPVVSSDELLIPHTGAVNQSALSATAPGTSDINQEVTYSVIMEHNYSLKRRRKQKRPSKDVVLPGKIKSLQSTIRRVRKKSLLLKQRPKNAEKISSNAAFQHLTSYIEKPAKLFLNMQKQQKNKPKGRRFSIEQKILCLSLFKKSPKCYKVLAKYFTLPLSRAMTRLLSQFKINE